MKTGIAGAGSLGSLFASFFAGSGIDTVLYEKSEDTVNCIKNGLKIITPSGEVILQPSISADPSILRDADIIFIFVKSYSTEEAAFTVSRAAKQNSIIVSLQNGLGNYESLCRHINSERIVYGTTTFGAARKSPAEIIFGGRGIVNIGGKSPDAVQKVKELLVRADIDTSITDNPGRIVWLKALINAGINPLASILGIKNGQILENTYALELQAAIIKEAVEAAHSAGIDFDYDTILEETRSICRKTANNTCSMLQDIIAGRKTEIESINLRIVETGTAAGINMECNRTVSMLVKALEESGNSSRTIRY